MNKEVKETRARRLAQLLEEKGVTLEEVSRGAGVHYGTLTKIKEGIIGNMQLKTAQKIAQYFTTDVPISANWVLGKNVPKYRQGSLLDTIAQEEKTEMDSTTINVMFKVLKIPQGIYRNVLLTDEELEALCNRYGANTVERAINYKSRLITEGKDRYTQWASDYAALFHYLHNKEREAKNDN